MYAQYQPYTTLHVFYKKLIFFLTKENKNFLFIVYVIKSKQILLGIVYYQTLHHLNPVTQNINAKLSQNKYTFLMYLHNFIFQYFRVRE